MKLERAGTAFGIGIVDWLFDEAVERGVLTGTAAYAQDGVRFIETVGGAIIDLAGPSGWRDIGEAAFLSSLPLTIKSAVKLVKGALKKTAAAYPKPSQLGYVRKRPVTKPAPAATPAAAPAVLRSF